MVTGASRGLGTEFVRQIVSQGSLAVATCRDRSDVERLRKEFPCVYQLDVTDVESIRAFSLALRETPIDVLVNNAAIGVGGSPFLQENWDSLVNYFVTNAIGPMRVAHALLEQLRAGQRKLVVNMSTVMSSLEGLTAGGAYGYRASKVALNMLTRTMAFDLKGDGLTCIAIHPGWVSTRMGGYDAPLSAEASVSQIMPTLASLTLQDTGRFIDLFGRTVPW